MINVPHHDCHLVAQEARPCSLAVAVKRVGLASTPSLAAEPLQLTTLPSEYEIVSSV